MRVSLPPLLAAAVLSLAACRDAKVQSYRVASETPEPLPPVLTEPASTAPTVPSAPASAGASMANTAVPTAGGAALSWTAPEHWRPKPGSAMRKGSYAVAGSDGAEADFSITAFPGNVGGELANVNRWRGQIGLSPIQESELETLLTRFEQDGLNVTVAEFANPDASPPQRMIGAIVPFEGATWFFKLTGPDALVAREKPALLALLRSVQAPDPVAQ